MNEVNEVFNSLANEADKIIKELNNAERRIDIAAPHYTKLQEVKLQAMQFRFNILQWQPITEAKKK